MRSLKVIGILTVIFCALLMVVLPSAYAKDKLRLAATTHADHVYTQTAYEFAKAVDKKTNGEIQVKVYPARQLGNEREQMEMVTVGSIEFSLPPMGIVTNIEPVWAGLQLPFIYANTQVAIEAYHLPILDKMRDRLKEKGVLAIAIGDCGLRPYALRNGLVRTIDDMKGLKIRALQSPLTIDSLKAVGASPTPLPYGEIYTGIQQGVIDGSDLDLGTIELGKFYEVAKYYTKVGYIGFPFLILMNKNKFDSYPASIQAAILEAGKEATEYNMGRLLKFERTAKEFFEGLGCKYNEVEDFPEWQKRVEWVIEKYSKDEPLVQEFLVEVKKLNQNYGK
jgi:tripartite ATP-independent transporter DctP family solute receptor